MKWGSWAWVPALQNPRMSCWRCHAPTRSNMLPRGNPCPRSPSIASAPQSQAFFSLGEEGIVGRGEWVRLAMGLGL